MFPKELQRHLLFASSLLLTLASSSELAVPTPHSATRNVAPDATAVHDFRRNSEGEQDQVGPPSCRGLQSGKIKDRDMDSDGCRTGSSIRADHNLAFGFPTNSTDWRECLPHYPAEK